MARNRIRGNGALVRRRGQGVLPRMLRTARRATHPVSSLILDGLVEHEPRPRNGPPHGLRPLDAIFTTRQSSADTGGVCMPYVLFPSQAQF